MKQRWLVSGLLAVLLISGGGALWYSREKAKRSPLLIWAPTDPAVVKKVRASVAWPFHVTLTEERLVFLRDPRRNVSLGNVVLISGVKLKAHSVDDYGYLTVEWQEAFFDLPLESTDLLSRIETPAWAKRGMESSAEAPAGTIPKPRI